MIEQLAARGYDVVDGPTAGGFGDVYRAVRLADSRVCAVKVLRAADRRRFEREVAVLRSLAHPSIPGLVDAAILADGTPFVVTDWVDGDTLVTLLRRDGPLDVDRAVQLVGDVADALASAHRLGIVHRDVSPANIIVRDHLGGEAAMLIDFGISRPPAADAITETGDLAGVPRYVAPEVLRGDDPSPASDQYALGLVLAEMLVGTIPFPDGGTVATVMHHHLDTTPTPLTEIDPGIPLAIDLAIDRALAKDPADRWPSVERFAAALTDVTVEPERPARRRGRAAAAVLAVVAFGGATIGLANRPGEPPADTATSLSPVGPPPETAASLSSVEPPADTAPVPTDGAEPAPAPIRVAAPWPSGTAAQLDCNLLDQADFENGEIGFNFYFDADNTDRVRIVSRAGVDDSAALVVGEANEFGLYAATVDVLPGEAYDFSVSAVVSGEVFDTTIGIEWLDANFDEITPDIDQVDVDAASTDRQRIGPLVAPTAARYALPRIYKDSSPGILLVDELVFSVAGTDCGS